MPTEKRLIELQQINNTIPYTSLMISLTQYERWYVQLTALLRN